MRAIIISISSDIGTALARRWLERGWEIFGTVRACRDLSRLNKELGDRVDFAYCDLAYSESVKNLCLGFLLHWDVLVLATGSLRPVGPFADADFNEWRRSVDVNFVNQMYVVHELLPRANPGSVVLFFAGGGRSTTTNYSAYVVSKSALVKMCDLLNAEATSTRFAIFDPGWVETKIHGATLEAGKNVGWNYRRTVDRFSKGDWVPMEEVLDRCDRMILGDEKIK